MIALPDVILVCARAAPDLPPSLWWTAAGVLLVLTIAAAVDAVKGIVPDALIALGFALLIGALGFDHEAGLALHAAVRGAVAACAIWALNRLWRAGAGHDALGMGDAKWTALAVACFGGLAGLYAWGIGAVLAACILTVARLVRRPVAHIHFAPFLLIGLGCGLYWTRFRFL